MRDLYFSRKLESMRKTKDYIVIYMVRHHNGYVTHYKHISCLPNEIKKCVEEEHDIDFGSVWFIFDGHCEQTRD